LTDPHSPEKDSPKSILPAQETALSLEKLQSRWPDFLHYLDQKKLLLKSHIQEASLVRFQSNELILMYPESMVFHARIVNEPENHNALCTSLAHFFNHHLTFKIEIDTPEPPTPLDPNSSTAHEDIQKVRALVKSNPSVSQALEILEGKVIRYQRKSKQESPHDRNE
jgi:hypothetical protein